jgi:sigma-B regulation protein RsbU (phosphoserine phosphatase)
LMATLNDVIHEAGNQQLVMTAFAVDVDRASRRLSFCAAGHPPQFILKPRDNKLLLGALGMPSKQLGDTLGASFKVETMTYEPGTRLVLYTDGIPECLNEKGEMYSDRRFRRLVQGISSHDIHEVTEAVFTDVKKFAGAAAQNDDVTLVAIELK